MRLLDRAARGPRSFTTTGGMRSTAGLDPGSKFGNAVARTTGVLGGKLSGLPLALLASL